MKNNILNKTFLFLFTSFALLSCSDVEPIDPPLVDVIGQDLVAPPAPSFTFKAKIDGVLFTADQAMASIITNEEADLSLTSITGFKLSSQQTISLNIASNSTGNYPLSFEGAFINFSNPNQGLNGMFTSNALFNPIIGNINITNLDMSGNKISGTFEGTLYNDDEDVTKIITEGVFTTVPVIIP